VDKAYETERKKVIPYKAQWVIAYAIRMSQPTVESPDCTLNRRLVDSVFRGHIRPAPPTTVYKQAGLPMLS
jgi:hypothetical protein